MGGTMAYSKETILEVTRLEAIGWFRAKVKFIVAQQMCGYFDLKSVGVREFVHSLCRSRRRRRP